MFKINASPSWYVIEKGRRMGNELRLVTFKVAVSDFWQPVLIFEITKTNTPLPQKGLAPNLIVPPHTYTYAMPMLLTYREKTKQPLHPITGLPTPRFLSSAGKLIWYLHGSCFLPYRNTVSTPEASNTTKYYRTHYNQWCCLNGLIPDSKLLPCSIYDVLTQI